MAPNLLSRETHARAILQRRDEAQKYLEEAHSKGDNKEARIWGSHIKKMDKMISEYGLERYRSQD